MSLHLDFDFRPLRSFGLRLGRTASALGLAAGLSVTASAATVQPPSAARTSYVVRLADAPVASYGGTIAGYAATRPAAGSKLDVSAAQVVAYRRYLDTRRSAVLSSVGSVPVTHRYNIAFNGFTALLTHAEAQKLKGTKGVAAVTPDTARHLVTNRTPAFLGLSTAGGLWSQLDAKSRQVKGEDVIVGVLDSGVWPEDPSFSDKTDANGLAIPAYQNGTTVYGAPPVKWKGSCQAGPGFTTAMCNNKLIGARFYNESFVNSGLPLFPKEYVSPRGQDGHGSHTASTAAGNSNVPSVILGVDNGTISGMAPRARVAVYKVCWSYTSGTTSQDTCFDGDAIAAIDQAVEDGVDVLNYSIGPGSPPTNFDDPVGFAFLNATAAGVFVAASAGNDGPGREVANIAPWITTVAASTHDRLSIATVTLGNGATYTGPSLSQGVRASPLVLAETVARAGAAADDARRCFLGSLDPAKVLGKIVVCDRGSNGRVEKSQEVKNEGGVGMILLNVSTAANDQIDDPHYVSTVHLGVAARPAIRAYAANAGATAAISLRRAATDVVAPVMADFSSRGPNYANPNLLKPDITAPGVNVLAANTYDPTPAEHAGIIAGTFVPPAETTYLSGTSMSSPHIAGIAALLKQLHPTWSPAAIKSAIMTSASGVKLANGSPDLDRWGYGAGHVNPNGAAHPGLVYDAGIVDYVQFLCGVGTLAPDDELCGAVGSILPWNLNLASLTTEVVGRSTVHRTVTNVGPATATFVASASLAGYGVAVQPASLTLAPGASAGFDVTLTRTSAPIDDWVFGNLTWTAGSTQVRSPLTARAQALSAPAELDDTRAAGSKIVTVATGYAGALSVTPTGLVAAKRSTGSVSTNGETCFNIDVPAGSIVARFQLFNSDTSGAGKDDLDMTVTLNGDAVGSSGGSSANELVQLSQPDAGTYAVCVQGYAPVGGKSTFTLSSWVLPGTTVATNMRAAAPAKVYLGGTGSVGVSWSVASGQRYLGALRFKDGASTLLGTSLLSVDTRTP